MNVPTDDDEEMSQSEIIDPQQTDSKLAAKESEILSLIVLNDDVKNFFMNSEQTDPNTVFHAEHINKCSESEPVYLKVQLGNMLEKGENSTAVLQLLNQNAVVNFQENGPMSNDTLSNLDTDKLTLQTGENCDMSSEVTLGKTENRITNNEIDANMAMSSNNCTSENNTNDVDVKVNADEIQLNASDGNATAMIEFNSADAAWITLLDKFEYIINEDRVRGYIDGEKNFLCLWERFQTSTMSTFCVRSSDRFYKDASEGEEGAVCGRILKGAAKWSRLPLVPYDGVPFVFMDRKYFGCRLGGIERRNPNKGLLKTTRVGHSLKVGCPAEAEVLEVWRVPDLQLPDEITSQREKRRIKQKRLGQVHSYILMERFTRRYYVTLPLISKHQNHPILDPQAGSVKYLHPKIIEKIYELVNEGIFEKRVIKYMLEEFVREFQTELGIEIQLSDRSFYPTDRDISNHIRNARKSSKKVEHTALSEFVVNEESVVTDVCNNENLNFTTEVVTNSFQDIVTSSGGITYISTQESDLIHPKTVATDAVVATYESTVNTNAYITTADVNTVTIDGVVPRDVMEYYSANGDNSADVMENDAMKLLLEPCRRKVTKKRERKWPLKPSKINRKQRDLKILLREEIQKSFAVMNIMIQEETDETKLHCVLKKVKCLQRMVEGRSNDTSKRNDRKRIGIQAMFVNLENKETGSSSTKNS